MIDHAGIGVADVAGSAAATMVRPARQGYPDGWSLAFVPDPDGNNIEAIHHGE